MCLQDPEGDHTVERALEEPHNFVLKPQREGRGEYLIISNSLFLKPKYNVCYFIAQMIWLLLFSDSNYYNNELHGKLEKMRGSVERETYFLVDKLRPPALPNLFLGHSRR